MPYCIRYAQNDFNTTGGSKMLGPAASSYENTNIPRSVVLS